MARLVLFTLIIGAIVATGAAQSVSPLVDYFQNINGTEYSYFWTALQAGHLDEYLNDSSLAITIFAPTNDAWLKRLPSLTTSNGITVQQLFSEAKSAAVQNMLQYHILNTVAKTSSFKNGDYLSTLANLCSDAKTLSVDVSGSNITLVGAGGTRPKLLDKGILVGSQAMSIVYAIDDVLLPSVVTIPLGVALANFNQTAANPYSPTIASKVGVLNQLQSDTQNEAPAPIFLQPASAPATSAPPKSTSTPATGGSPSPPPRASPSSPTPAKSSSPGTSVGQLSNASPPPPSNSGIDSGVATGRR